MVPTTAHQASHSRAGTVRALKMIGVTAMWVAIAADFAGILPRSTPRRFDWLLLAVAAVVTLSPRICEAFRIGTAAGRAIERHRQARTTVGDRP
jgi:hypothetical protein